MKTVLWQILKSAGVGNLFAPRHVSSSRNRHPVIVMRAYLANLPTRTWLMLVVPAIAIAYPVVWIMIPAVVRAVVPDVVRHVLRLI